MKQLGELKQGDVFYTEYSYALKDTPERCNTFTVISVTEKNVKCLACNFKYPQLFYFKKDKKIIV